MNYTPLTEYRHAWFYHHKDMPVSAEDLELIKPMTPARAYQLWTQMLSKQSDDITELAKDDWASHSQTWVEEGAWQSAWDSESLDLPDLFNLYFPWDNQTVVYFCYGAEHIVETRWDVFRRCWKNFLFIDDSPILLGKKRKEVAQFFQNGSFRLGQRP